MLFLGVPVREGNSDFALVISHPLGSEQSYFIYIVD